MTFAVLEHYTEHFKYENASAVDVLQCKR